MVQEQAHQGFFVRFYKIVLIMICLSAERNRPQQRLPHKKGIVFRLIPNSSKDPTVYSDARQPWDHPLRLRYDNRKEPLIR